MTTNGSGVDYARWLALTAFLVGCPSSSGSPPADAGQDTAADQATVEDVPSEAATPTDGPVAGGIGDPCTAEGNPFPPQRGTCAPGQLCLVGQIGFRNGYCSRACAGALCPTGSVCGRYQSFPICFRGCTSNADCRTEDGYVCGVADGATQRVCRVNDEPEGAREDGSACFTRGAGGAHPLTDLPRRAFPITAQRGNLSVSMQRTDSLVEAEGNIAVNPANGNVASTYIALDRGTSFMGASHSQDNGMNWFTDGRVTDPMLNSTSDPVLDYGRDGTLRMTFIGIGRDGSGRITNMHVRVSTSRDNGAMWTAPVQVEVGTSCGGGRLCDKPWIASGPSATAGVDSLYIVYLQQGQNSADVLTQRSDDGGMTWSAPVTVARAMMSFDGSTLIPNLAQIATGPSALAAVSWVSLSSSQGSVEGNLVRLGSDANRIFFRRSTDGMRTFETTRRVSRDTDSPVYTQPPVALDGNTTHVMYVSGEPTGAWDIILATSTDNGASWRHRKVNDDPDTCATHAFPAMVVDPMTHDVHAVWLENRFGDGALVYARCPADAARPCGQNEIVSDMPFNFTTSRNPMTWHGDYIGLTINPATGHLWATWSDTRQGFPAMYVQRGNAR
jgi:hypothetical protein